MSHINRPQGVPNRLSGTAGAMSPFNRPQGLAIAYRALLVVGLVLAGCQPALRPPALVSPVLTSTQNHEATVLWGQVVAGYATQATAAQLVSYATVTLLDGSNQVVATGLTDASGAFSLNPFVTWTPTTNAVYVLDALKSFDRTNDRAGLRFRTLVSWDGSQWRSLSGTTASPSGGAGVLLSASTTALAAIQSLRARSGSALLATLDPATAAFTETDGVTASEVTTVTALVNQALLANLDPIAYLKYASSDGSYALKLGSTATRTLFDLEDAMGVTVNSRTALRGHDGGAAYAFGSSIALYQSQLGASGSIGGLMANPMGVDADRYGNVYVADFINNRIQKFSPEGRFLTSIGTLGSGSVQFDRPTDVKVDAQGNLLVSDYQNNRLQKLDPYGNLIFGLGGGGRWTGAAPLWSTIRNNAMGFFYDVHYAKFDAAGNIWVSDYWHHRLLKYDPNGNFLLGIGGGTKWTTPYQPNSLQSNVTANFDRTVTWGAAVARNTDGLASDGTHAYIHDSNATNGGFFKIRLSDGAVLAGPGTTRYLGSIRGSLAYVNGKLYYRGSGTGLNKIVVIDTSTMSEVGYLLQNGTGTVASANNDAHPWGTTAGWMTHGLTTDGRYLYIPEDTTAGTTVTIRVYDPYNSMAWVKDVVCAVPAGTMNFDHHAMYSNGDYLFIMRERTTGSTVYKFRLADGAYLGTEAFNDPLAANPAPACFDYVNQRVMVHDHETNRFTVFHSNISGTGNGYFNNPTGFTVTPSGEIYVCDRSNHRLQKFDASGNYVTQWGSLGTAAGQFNRPEDVALDQAGNLWVTEYDNHRIQKFDRAALYLGMFGSNGPGNGQFNIPRGIAVAPDGTILIGDWSNNRVQRLLPTGPKLVSPSSGTFNAARGTISFWFKPNWNGSDVGGQVFFRQNGTNNFFGLHKMGSQFYLYVTDTTGDPTRALRVGLAAADTIRLIKAGEWHHVAATWEAATGQLRFFFNGKEYASFASNLGTPMVFGPSGPFSIGSEPDDLRIIDSVLDDFRIFDTPKSAEEILRDYRGLVEE